MARIRTTPAQLPAISKDLITGFRADIRYSEGADPQFEGATFSYMFRQIDESGGEVTRSSRTASFAELPAGLKTDLRSVYSRILAIAEAKGDIGAGADEDELAGL